MSPKVTALEDLPILQTCTVNLLGGIYRRVAANLLAETDKARLAAATLAFNAHGSPFVIELEPHPLFDAEKLIKIAKAVSNDADVVMRLPDFSRIDDMV